MNIQDSKLFVTKPIFNPDLLYGGVAVRIVGDTKGQTFTVGNYIVTKNTGDVLSLVGYQFGKTHTLHINMDEVQKGDFHIKIIAGADEPYEDEEGKKAENDEEDVIEF